jgi:hypothetical protein
VPRPDCATDTGYFATRNNLQGLTVSGVDLWIVYFEVYLTKCLHPGSVAGFNADPDRDPDPALFCQCWSGSGSRILMTNKWKNLQLKKSLNSFDKKFQYTYP